MLKETSFLLPRIDNIVINFSKGDRFKKLKFLGYRDVIDETKDKISNINNNTWTKLRKTTNTLEYPVSGKQKPISRAFFKLLEIMKDFNTKISGNTFHLCEAPGGFIQTVLYVSHGNRKYYTFSLLGDKSVPMYSSSILNNNNVVVMSNKQNNGDIYSTDNIKSIVSCLKDKNVTFITGDGGFCEINDFSNKEQLHHKLIYNQMITAIHVLQGGGDFVLKIFDIYTELTFDCIYLLSFLFESVYICKPNTSRPTNSEKYLYCKSFKKERLTQDLKVSLQRMCVKGVENYSSFIHKGTVPKEFTASIMKINTYFSDYQMYSINNILEIYKLNIKVNRNKKNEEEWIKKYYSKN